MAEIRIPTSRDEHRTRQRLIEAAVELLAGPEFHDDLIEQLAAHTGYTDERIETFFRSSEDVVIALYNRFASDIESRVAELPDTTVAERFRVFMTMKQEMMEPFRVALNGLSPSFLTRRTALGVFSPETEAIRVRVRGVIADVIEGAADHDGRSTADLTAALYTAYLSIMWLWLRSRDRARSLTDRVARAISFSSPYLDRAALRLPLKVFAAIQRTVIAEDRGSRETAAGFLKQLFVHRRLHADACSCQETSCPHCLAIHLPKAGYFITTGQPIHMILPAFPAKSPNRKKTIGTLPDMAEQQALLYLGNICRRLSEIHPPGVRLTICSDGHVFSDLVGVTDDDVSAYGAELEHMLSSLELTDVIDTFSLNDLYEDLSFDEMRAALNKHYTQDLDELRARAAQNTQLRATVDGIQRFLFEDTLEIGLDRSRTQIRNECRDMAYRVIQRSDAWGRLLSDCFPMALRLSIHPQMPHSDKIGILLGEANDVWLTPWHGVAVRYENGFKMMKRFEAEALGARFVESDGGAPAFYEL